MAFFRLFAFPVAVLGPVDFAAFRRFASIFNTEVGFFLGTSLLCTLCISGSASASDMQFLPFPKM
jgi:hypothetical protein